MYIIIKFEVSCFGHDAVMYLVFINVNLVKFAET